LHKKAIPASQPKSQLFDTHIHSRVYTDRTIKMSWSQMKTMDLPNKWSEAVMFKDPSKDDKLGFIDAIGRGGAGGQQRGAMVTFKFLTAKDEPVGIKPVRGPWECFTIEDILGKGRGKVTMRMQINKKMWESLDDLDMNFRGFLIKHRAKLFSQQDAEYIGRDNSAIALKCKPLAPRNIDGTPMYDSFITLRVNGRTGEIESLDVKDGPTGKFVSKIKWAPRVTPLSAIATRFSIVVGWTVSMTSGSPAVPKVKDTLPLALEDRPVGWSAGDQRVRYVGPGDIADGAKGGSAARYACIRPAYWSLAPGGNASITLVLDSMIIDAGVGDLSAPQDVPDVFVAPEGFAYAEPLESVEEDARIATLGSSSGPTSTGMAAASSSALSAAGGGGGGSAFTTFNSDTQPRLAPLHKPFASGGLSNGLYSDMPPGAPAIPMSAPKRSKPSERVEITDYAVPPSRANTGGAGGGSVGVAAGMQALIAQRSRSLRIFDADADEAELPELDDMVPRRGATGGGAGGAAASSSSSSSSSSADHHQAMRQRQAERDALEHMRHTSTAAYQCTQEPDEEDIE
jgi:hypothetical protein